MKKMKKIRISQFGLWLVVLTATSCGFPRLPELADGNAGAPLPFGLELLAGDIGGPGSVDGTGAAARFHFPWGVAIDSTGNLYVADQFSFTIRKVTPAGVVTTLAGAPGVEGCVDGTGAAAHFNQPYGVAVDSPGNVYVADCDAIRKITAAGIVTTLAGTAGMSGSADGTGAAARFYVPTGVAVDSGGNVYVAEQFNDTIRKITAAGIVTTLAGTAGMSGSADGTGVNARFFEPSGVAVDSAGNVYVADTGNGTIRKVTAAGVVTTLAGAFDNPIGVALDSAGNIYVASTLGSTIHKVTATGVVTTLAGTAQMSGSTDGTGAAARFAGPVGVAVDSAGNIYVADSGNNTIRKVTAAGVVTTLAGTVSMAGSADDTGAAARFKFPTSVAVDSAGNTYVADSGNNTIRKVTAAGVVTTLAGTAGRPGSADGTGAAAGLSGPSGIAVDSGGTVYVADGTTIRKVTAAGVVTTLAGTAGMSGSTDGTGAAARFSGPSGVAVDSGSNVYVADGTTIRKVTAAGVVTTLAGTAGMYGSADGTGAEARFWFPAGVAIDSAGNIYVADWGVDTIRKVTAAGIVTTLAGASMYGSTDGTGAAARFNRPTGVAVDSEGNVYVADQNNSTIRKVTPTGVTTTVAGMAGLAGILLGTTPRFGVPRSLAIFGDSLVVSDTNAILLLRHGAQ